MRARAVFWLATGMIAWVYAGYPLLALAAGRVRPFRVQAQGAPARRVTVAIAIHNEARTIEARIANVLEQELDAEIEVIVGSDGSTDSSEEIVGRLAQTDPRVRLLLVPRGGQTATQNAIAEAATGEVIVLTDAQTRYEPGCLSALVAPFVDSRVGCTTGVLGWRNETASRTAGHESVYWRYEQVVRRLESQAGWLSSGTGALLAFRRSIMGQVPPHSSYDHIAPLIARAAGRVVLAVPEARATDRVVSGLRAQFHNRSRTATRGIAANLAMARELPPWRQPGTALAIWSHKLLRWASPWAALVATASAASLWRSGRRAYAVPVAAAVATPAAAGAELLIRRGGGGTRWGSAALAVVIVNAAFLRGWLNLFGRRRITIWHRTSWQSE